MELSEIMRLCPVRFLRIRVRRVMVKLCFFFVCILFTWWTIGRMYSLISQQEFYDRPLYVNSDLSYRTYNKVYTQEISRTGFRNRVEPITARATVEQNSMKKDTESPSIARLDNVGVSELIQRAKRINIQGIVNTSDALPTDFMTKGIAIVIQVHDRAGYLQNLVSSLREAKNIENSLLIISMDFFSHDVLSVLQSIDFCEVHQIFFPYSMQLFPYTFPGSDPHDCPRDVSRDMARSMKCVNAEHPDKYGHYREAKFTMTKHHWWWKANVVFDKILAKKNYNGPVLFLEDDHYVAPDFIPTLRMMNQLRTSHADCEGNTCDIMTLGGYESVEDFGKVGSDLVLRTTWQSNKHNMGMSITRDVWQKIKEKSMNFCTYDDYNWDWTLMYLSLKVLQSPFIGLVMKAPRVFHLGDCGLHHKKKQCNVQEALRKYKTVISNNMQHLFKDSFRIISDRKSGILSQPNGGWGDIRDHELCHSYINTSR